MNKEFIYPLNQISEFYYKKEIPKESDNNGGIVENKNVEGICAICYEDPPNIYFEPCNHGAICKTCLVNNIEHSKNDSRICPVCKAKINRIFLMKYNVKEKRHYVSGEIKFKIWLIFVKIQFIDFNL